MNGLFWDVEGLNTEGNLLNIVTNRAGGVGIMDENANEINLWLTRFVNNINWNKGLPTRLDDTTQTQLDLLI